MNRFLALLLLVASSTASAVVIRHDVDDSKYQVPASEFPALADMPCEAHGVLIAPQWVVTAAHTIPGSSVEEITLNGVPRKVERVIFHPGYRGAPPQALITQALAGGGSSKVMEFLAASDDIALIKLAAPVTDVTPATLYRGKDGPGQRVKLVGKGGTGTGVEGQGLHSPHRTVLRRAFNTITSADGRWLGYVFDTGPSAHALEGMGGGGDSGGPLLIEVNGQWQLAGLASWKGVKGAELRGGLYGQTSYNVRLSKYAKWMEAVMSSARPDKSDVTVDAKEANHSFKPKPLCDSVEFKRQISTARFRTWNQS